MNDIVRYKIPEYLNFTDLFNFSLVDKNHHQLLKNQLEISKIKKIKQIETLFPDRIIDIIGKNNFIKAENIKWQQKWMGWTDYIDSVKFKHLNDVKECFSYGVDSYRRSFVFVKMINIKKNKKFLIIVFQRYTDGETYVAIDPTGASNEILKGNCLIDDYFANDLKELFENKNENFKLYFSKMDDIFSDDL